MHITKPEDIIGEIENTVGTVIVGDKVYYNGQFMGDFYAGSEGWAWNQCETVMIKQSTASAVYSKLCRLNRLWADGDEKKLAMLGVNR